MLAAVDRLFSAQGATRRLSVVVVEGDEVRLENTDASVVRGRRVSIGPGCRIETVEYRDGLDVHPRATVEARHRTATQRGRAAAAAE